MESQFQNLKTLDRTPEFVSTKRILFFRDGNSVEKYIQFVGPHFIDAVLVSADGEYPQDVVLKENAHRALSLDHTVAVIVFNSDAFSRWSVATQRILILDSIMIHSYRYYEPHLDYRVDLTGPQISKIINSFFTQWSKLSIETNFSLSYSAGTTFVPPRESDLRFEMMGLSPRRTLVDELVMFETIFYRVKYFLAANGVDSAFPEIKEIEEDFIREVDDSRDRFFNFSYKRLMVGVCAVRVEEHNLLVRCFYFEPTFNQPENFKLGLKVLQKVFAKKKTIQIIIPPHQQSLFENMGFVLVAKTSQGTLKMVSSDFSKNMSVSNRDTHIDEF